MVTKTILKHSKFQNQESISVDLIKKKNIDNKKLLTIKDNQKNASKLEDDKNKKPNIKNDKKEVSIV